MYRVGRQRAGHPRARLHEGSVTASSGLRYRPPRLMWGLKVGTQGEYNRAMSRFSSFSKFPGARRPQAVAEVLGRTDAFAALRAGVEQISSLERELAQILPEYLAANVEPGFIKDGTLTLFAAHGALAARLRQVEPRLLAELQQRGWPVRALTFKVRPRAVVEPPPPKQARMTPAGAAALQALSRTLAPSPLQAALAKMAARHGKPTDESA